MSWQNQEVVYVIMWRSQKSGGTYTELRRTEQGRDRLLNTLKFMGVDPSQIVVTEQKKVWKPDLRKNGKRKKQEGVIELVKAEKETQFLLPSGGRTDIQ